jgi:hypothetical protein
MQSRKMRKQALSARASRFGALPEHKTPGAREQLDEVSPAKMNGNPAKTEKWDLIFPGIGKNVRITAPVARSRERPLLAP